MSLDSMQMTDIVGANHNIAVDIYQTLSNDNLNVFLSPISIQLVLMLTYLGARGTTADEIEKALHFATKKQNNFDDAQELLSYLQDEETLSMATNMFIEQQFNIKEDFLNDAKKYLNANPQLVNFASDIDNSLRVINSWVSQQTRGKIKDLLKPGMLNLDTRLVLVNAVYFKDIWKTRFNISDTRQQVFHASKEKKIDVSMMSLENEFLYYEDWVYQALELPYQNDFKMLILLPNTIGGLSALESHLPYTNILDLRKAMYAAKVQVQIPKFKLEETIDLSKVFMKLGVHSVFSEIAANLTGIHEPSELFVSAAMHKAFVEVTEEGTQATAATAAIFETRMFQPVEIDLPNKTFVADRPFVFFILKESITLFMGRVSTIN